jgi:membrane-bound serine protease (ClpP class)
LIAGRRLFGARLLFLLIMGVMLLGAGFGSAAQAAGDSAGAVYVIPVKQTVQSGLASFLDRALTEAEEAKASLVVLDVDTPGGRLESAEAIGKRIRETKVPTVAFVSGKAASAGAYLAMNAGAIAMAPGSAIGAAMIVDADGNAVNNPKYVSFWSETMASAADINGRDRRIAAAMVDPSVTLELKEIGRTKEKGQILSLTAGEALKVGYSERMAKTAGDVIAWKGLSERTVVELNPTFSERLSEWVTGPGVSTMLLIIGLAGIAIEMLVPGFGAPGIIGLLAFGLYFFGQSIAGFAGMESIVFFLAGVILLVLEMFVPSFGILGILGIAGLIYGIASAAFDTGNAVTSLGYASMAALVLVVIFAYVFRKRGIWNRFILRDKLTAEEGYVPNAPRQSLLGQEGVTLSALRPAGVAGFSGQRMDVVSSGEFIERGKPVKITLVDGTRIVVKEIELV